MMGAFIFLLALWFNFIPFPNPMQILYEGENQSKQVHSKNS